MAILEDSEYTAHIISATRHWLQAAVIGLNLCPFAKSVHAKGQIRYAVSDASTPDALLEDLIAELHRLHETPDEVTDTTLLIHPRVLADFLDYNAFLDVAEAAVEDQGLSGELQVASFHPHYQFADTAADDIGNFTNRSPYPILHLLREASIDRAVEAFPEAEQIYLRNIEVMQQLGLEGWQALKIEPGREK